MRPLPTPPSTLALLRQLWLPWYLVLWHLWLLQPTIGRQVMWLQSKSQFGGLPSLYSRMAIFLQHLPSRHDLFRSSASVEALEHALAHSSLAPEALQPGSMQLTRCCGQRGASFGSGCDV